MADDVDARFNDIIAERRDGTLAAGIAAVVCILLAAALYVWQGSFVSTPSAAALQVWLAPLSSALAIAGGVLGGLAVWERMTGPRAAASPERRRSGARRLLWVGLALVAVFVAWQVVDFLLVVAAMQDLGNPAWIHPALQWLSMLTMWLPTVVLQLGLTLVALSLWARWSTSLP